MAFKLVLLLVACLLVCTSCANGEFRCSLVLVIFDVLTGAPKQRSSETMNPSLMDRIS
jgi:hypothetical protein